MNFYIFINKKPQQAMLLCHFQASGKKQGSLKEIYIRLLSLMNIK
jgi:hypothetical protein